MVYYGLGGLILLLSGISRFYDLPSRVIFSEDQALFWRFAYKNIIYYENIVCGPSIGGVWATFPPTFYYLTTFLLKVTNFNFFSLFVMTAVTNLLALIIMYIKLPKYFGKRATLVAIFLYGLSFCVISESVVGSNPGILPPLAVLLIISCIELLYYDKVWALPVLTLIISVMTHFHITAFFLVPAITSLLTFKAIIVIIKRQLSLFNITAVLAIMISLIIVLYVGVRPHYLQNKAFGNQNFEKIKTAIFNGVPGNDIPKKVSITNFFNSLRNVNGDFFFPNPKGFQEFSPTSSSVNTFGTLVTLVTILTAIYLCIKVLVTKKITPLAIISSLFLSHLIFLAVLPAYLPNAKPNHWLNPVYFPFFSILVGTIIAKVLGYLGKRSALVAIVIVVMSSSFIISNGRKWLLDERTISPETVSVKLKNVQNLTEVMLPLTQNEDKINLSLGGAVNSGSTWPHAIALWKATGNTRYLRNFIWNVDPEKNQPFYIFTRFGDSSLSQSEKLAKSFQDYPQIIKLNTTNEAFVEKVFNNPSVIPIN